MINHIIKLLFGESTPGQQIKRALGDTDTVKVRVTQRPTIADSSSIPEGERKYYKPDEYYEYEPYDGAAGRIVDYEDRIKDAIPSRDGLYPPEILLIFHCNKYHNYPNPKHGYPGFWWFKYGIRDVGKPLRSLERRGFIRIGNDGKYAATKIGEQELAENGYVQELHRSPNIGVDIWTANKLLQGNVEGGAGKITAAAQKQREVRTAQDEAIWDSLAASNPEFAKMKRRLSAQDCQIQAINSAETKYKADGDLNAYIKFWQGVWQKGGPKFRGIGWTFRAVELYIKAGRYDDAQRLLDRIEKERPIYADVVPRYRDRLQKKMAIKAHSSRAKAK